MSLHRNATLGLAGRFALVCAVERGASLRSAAAAFNVSPATAHRWWHRRLAAGEEARSTLSCLFDRSSRPHRSPGQLAPEFAEAICDCRRKTGSGPRLVAGATGFAHSTVSKVLARAGIEVRRGSSSSEKLAAAYAPPANRAARPLHPGRSLLHTKRGPVSLYRSAPYLEATTSDELTPGGRPRLDDGWSRAEYSCGGRDCGPGAPGDVRPAPRPFDFDRQAEPRWIGTGVAIERRWG